MSKLADMQDFIRYLHEQVENHSIYTWGAQGQTGKQITEAWIRSRETSEDNADRAIAFWKRQVALGYGDALRAFDCSGLGMFYLRDMKGIVKSDMSSNGMMKKCDPIPRAALQKGDFVFRIHTSGKDAGKAFHIGYVVDDALFVIEAKGRDAGVVKRALNASGSGYWNACGRPFAFFSIPESGDEIKAQFAICNGGTVNFRKGPGTSHDALGIVKKGEKLLIGESESGFVQAAALIQGKMTLGYISRAYVDVPQA